MIDTLKMSKWRPAGKDCLYTVGDIHGSLSKLELICNRILPLRKSDGIQDKLIFLGDYIDRHLDSHKTIDFLIELKKKYQDQVIFLRGNHEQMLLKAANKIPNRTISAQDRVHNFRMWFSNGGLQTLMGYSERSGRPQKEYGENFDNLALCMYVAEYYPASISSCCALETLIPQEHWDFFNSTIDYYEQDHFVFVHGGCNPNIPLNKHEPEALYWDRRLVQYVLNCINADKEEEINWDKVIITGHSGPKPVIHEKFMMLDAGGPKQVLVVELNTLEAFIAKGDNAKLTAYNLEKTVKTKKLFQRSS